MYFTSVLHVFEDSLTSARPSLSDEDVVRRLQSSFVGIANPEQLESEEEKLAESRRTYGKRKHGREELRLVHCLYLHHKMKLLQLVYPTWWQQLGATGEKTTVADFVARNRLRSDLAHGNELATTKKEWQDVLTILRRGQQQQYARALASTTAEK